MWGIEIVVMLGMIGMNGVLAAYEIALASISRARLQALAAKGRLGSAAALHMKKNMEGSLAVVQLGITLVGAIAAATAGAGAEEVLAPKIQSAFGTSSAFSQFLAIALVVAPLTVLTIIFGELIPKVFALRNKELVCLRMSPAMKWFSYAVWPIVWFLESTVKALIHWGERLFDDRLEEHRELDSIELQELRASVALARTSRLIGNQEEKIILGAAQLSRRPVSEVMLDAEFISLLDANSTVSDALISAHLDMHTRFPVTEQPGDPQHIIGYVIFKDIVAHLRFTPDEPSLRPIIRKIASFRSDTPVANCLERLIREHSHIALIRDHAGQVVGMVTMEDMLEELVGDILDEYDKLPAHAVPTGKGWIVGGGLSLESLKTQTGVNLIADPPDAAVRCVSDWIEDQLEGPIHGSEVIDHPEGKITVRKSRRHKVMEAYLQPKTPKPA